jgi:hypothetical protein
LCGDVLYVRLFIVFQCAKGCQLCSGRIYVQISLFQVSSVSGYDSLEAVNLSFCNPHYMGPDLKGLAEKQQDDLHYR